MEACINFMEIHSVGILHKYHKTERLNLMDSPSSIHFSHIRTPPSTLKAPKLVPSSINATQLVSFCNMIICCYDKYHWFSHFSNKVDISEVVYTIGAPILRDCSKKLLNLFIIHAKSKQLRL